MPSAHPTGVPPNPEMAQLRASLLGGVHIVVGDRVVADTDWPRRSARSLVLLLLTVPRHSLSRVRIIDQLWPEASPEAGMNALRVALHAARRTLEPDLPSGRGSAYLISEGDVISLGSPAALWVDADQFEIAIAALGSMPVEDGTEAIRDALSLYGGELLADEPDAGWAEGRRERLRRYWRDAVLALAEIDVPLRSLRSVSALEQLLDTDVSDEAAHRALMRVYLAAGQRDEALRQYTRCVEALQRELDVEPAAETIALAAEIRAAATFFEPTISLPLKRRMEHLPVPPNALIGRARELAMLEDLLLERDVRLVTLTGPGGIGKTRLALEAAQLAASDFPEGVCFVDLSAIAEPALVLPTILRTIGLEEVASLSTIQVLAQSLREFELLLVLDNLEQVIQAACDIGALLASCPGITILATSRQPLHIRAEHVITTPPLAVPPVGVQDRPDQRAASLADRYDAVALFVARARASQPGFEVTDRNAAAVTALCSRLDGLPLAIELAAARTRHLDPAELLAQLETRLPLLTGGARDLPARQRTLRNAISWSHDLLEEEERQVFRRISVFSGDFSIEAALAICGMPGADQRQNVETIWTLVDKSLLQRLENAGESGHRYRMLETIREFALEQLIANSEDTLIRRRHASWYQTLAEHAEPLLRGSDQISWLERLEQEHDNFRAALEWACYSGETETALRLGGALSEFWRVSGYLGEGRGWLARALALADDVPSDTRAIGLRGAGLLAQAQGDSEEAITRLNQALSDWRDLGDKRRTAQTIGLLGDIARARGEYDHSIALNNQALALFEEIGFIPGVADTLNQLGIIASDRAEYDRADDFFRRSSDIFTQLGDRHGSARVLNNLGSLSFWQEEYQDAIAFYERSLDLWRALGHRPHTALVLANLGESLRAEGDLEQAMAITQEGLQVSREVGDKRSEATALFILGSLIQHQEYDDSAIEPLAAGLQLYAQVGDRLGMAWCLEALSGAATAQGRPDIAALFLGAAEWLRETVGIALKPAEQSAYQRHLDATRSGLDSAELFLDTWKAGRDVTTGQLNMLASELLLHKE